MGRGKPLTVKLYVGGVEVKTLTEEQREYYANKMGEALSRYYERHPDQWKKYLEIMGNNTKTT